MIKLLKGRKNLRDFLQIQAFINNYIGFTLSVYGYGILCMFQIHDPTKEKKTKGLNTTEDT